MFVVHVHEPTIAKEEGRPAGTMATQTWEWGWQWRAACRGEDTGLFFPPHHPEVKDERLSRERRAKAICGVCPVRMECLEYAIRIREPHGVWGGLNEIERRAMLRQLERDLRSVP